MSHLGGVDRSPERKAHDLQMVSAWRENLLALMVDAELAFQIVESDTTWAFGEEDQWAKALEMRVEHVRRRSDALLAHVIHAQRYVELMGKEED